MIFFTKVIIYLLNVRKKAAKNLFKDMKMFWVLNISLERIRQILAWTNSNLV